MPITVDYDTNTQIIVFVYTPTWTVNEFRQTLYQAIEMTKQYGDSRGVLVDLTHNGDYVPPNLIGVFRQALEVGPEKMVFVGSNTLTRMMFETVQKIQRRKHQLGFVDTLEEAYQFLNVSPVLDLRR